MEFLVQNKEFILLLASVIGIIFYFRSLSKDLRTEMHAEIKDVRSEIKDVRSEIKTLYDRIDDLSRTMNSRIDSLYNLLATQGKSK